MFNNVVTSRPYTIEILQQALTFANEKNPISVSDAAVADERDETGGL
ncbi:hypothetical protein ACLK11_22625 [Escherichia coli]